MTDMIIYGKADECEKLLAYADNIDRCHVKQTEHYDTFLSYLSEKEPSAVFILTDGADGMEGVIAAKNIFPSVPIVWISDDKGFGAQSYRLGCVFFAVKPLKERSALMAFSRIEKHRTNRHADAEAKPFRNTTQAARSSKRPLTIPKETKSINNALRFAQLLIRKLGNFVRLWRVILLSRSEYNPCFLCRFVL